MNKDTLEVAKLRKPFSVQLALPGSKSESNRAIALACLSPGKTTLTGVNPCDDVQYMVKAMRTLGWTLEWDGPTTLHIQGIDKKKAPQVSTEPIELFCGNAGTAVRFLTSIVCTVPGKWVITGDKHMQKRPIGDLISALQGLGIDISSQNGCVPISISGGTITTNTTKLDASKSSQFLTSLLQIGPVLPNGLHIQLTSELTSPTYIEMTCRMMGQFGASVSQEEQSYTIDNSVDYTGVQSYEIEGDWSGAGTFFTLAHLANSEFIGTNLRKDSTQGDSQIPAVLESMKQDGDISIDCTAFPDQMMNLCLAAAARTGKTHFYGAANLRIKECDRIDVITTQLKKVGIAIEQHNDGVDVSPSPTLHSATLNPSDDHRMAMCFGALGSVFEGITIENPSCVAKTYPHFFDDLQKCHTSAKPIAIVGMRACGKTTLAKMLSKKIQMKRIDSDALISKQVGNISDFVLKHGWPAFRTKEEEVIQSLIEANTIVSLGGGAIESEKTCALLQERTVVIWLNIQKHIIIKRLLEDSKRPALTDKPLKQEVEEVLSKRLPIFSRIADIEIPPHSKISKYPIICATELEKLCTW